MPRAPSGKGTEKKPQRDLDFARCDLRKRRDREKERKSGRIEQGLQTLMRKEMSITRVDGVFTACAGMQVSQGVFLRGGVDCFQPRFRRDLGGGFRSSL